MRGFQYSMQTSFIVCLGSSSKLIIAIPMPPLKMRGWKNVGQLTRNFNVVVPAWSAGIQADMDVSGGIPANLGSGNPCRNDGLAQTQHRGLRSLLTSAPGLCRNYHFHIKARGELSGRNLLRPRRLGAMNRVPASDSEICLVIFGPTQFHKTASGSRT